LRLHGIAASSVKKDELQRLLERARIHGLLDDETSGDDADESKHASPEHAIMIGDTPYDIEAARRAGVATIAFRSGDGVTWISRAPSPSTTAPGA